MVEFAANRASLAVAKEGAERPVWRVLGGRALSASAPFGIMGIVNVTPDSFFDGGEHMQVEQAVAHALRLRDEGIRDDVSILVGGSIRSSADVVKAIALGADACYIGTAALLALGCHLCRTCHAGRCNWGIATQRPDLVKRLNPDIGYKRLVNLVTAWNHEIQEMMGGMGINSIEALRGNRLMLRGLGLNETELRILGIKYAGESM